MLAIGAGGGGGGGGAGLFVHFFSCLLSLFFSSSLRETA